MEIRTAYRKKLKEIIDDMLVMSIMVGKAILYSVESSKDRKLDLAKQVIANDVTVNCKRFEIEEKCIKLTSYPATHSQ